VTYRVEFGPRALRQLNRFPADGLDELVPVMADVTQYPDDPLRTRPLAGSGARQAIFGGVGLVTYEIDEAHQIVMVTDMTWAG
jgi:hypothetical protein